MNDKAKEQGRILGIRQAASFVRRLYDNPVIADEVLKYVIPHGYKAKDEVHKIVSRKIQKGEGCQQD